MLAKEKNYDFRKRLLAVHKEALRDYDETPAASELEITDGALIVVSKNASDVVLTAAKDFVDYLFTSMGVSAMLKKSNALIQDQDNAIILSLQSDTTTDLEEADGYMGYRIDTGSCINVCGYDERGIAQALYYLEDIMNIRKAPYVEKGIVKRKPLFSPRMIHSGYGLDNFPNEHLSAIAHAGMDAILVFTRDVDTTPSGYLDFNELIYRAGKYGIDVYSYSYLVSHKHPDDSDAAEFYDNLYGRLFEKCPKLKGIVLVGESVEFPSKDKHVSSKFYYENDVEGIPTGKPSAGWWPCEDYPKWLERVKTAIYKHNSKADIVFWTYNWGYAPKEDRLKLINALPTDISIQVTYEMFETYDLGDATEACADYTLSFEGPGKYFVSEAIAAKERGIRLYAMSNTGGLTWDIGVIPYEPMPYQWIKRYNGLLDANEKWGLCGLMESHHYGFWPSFISELAKRAFYAPKEPIEKALGEILAKKFGKSNVFCVDEALKLWSEAITHYTPTDEDQYGAFRIGPSYPFCLYSEIKPIASSYAMFGNSICMPKYPAANQGRCSLSSIRIHEEIASLTKMLELMVKGVNILESIESKDNNEELLYLINLGKFICCCTQTGINAKNWYLLTSRLKIESNRNEIQKLIYEIEKLASEEIANAERALPLVESDSRLGWEPSMEYMTDAEHIKCKIRQVKYVLESELAEYKKSFEFIAQGNDYERHDFKFNGHDVVIVIPKVNAKSNPWVWRAEFFGAFDYADRELLNQGWHIAYYKISDMYGCPSAVDLMKKFHDYIVKEYNLSNKADLFGFSRGGLYAANYTLKYSQDVSTLYLDAPVLDIRSWPAGYGKGVGGEEWKECMNIYGLTEDTAKSFKDNPVNHINELIKTNIPVILVAGDSDIVVPYEENGEILVSEFINNNAKIKSIVKKGIGHHPHSLESPYEIVEFIKDNRLC